MKKYSLKKITDFVIDDDINQAVWQTIEPLTIDNWLWCDNNPALLPAVTVKCCYSQQGIYILFTVQEAYLLARCTDYQGEVWFDSCVEFFVAPNSRGYFNFEINCIGNLLLHWNELGQAAQPIPLEHISNLKIKSSLPAEAINQPMPSPVEQYRVECFLPFHIFKRYCNAESPQPGENWRANFYKCGEELPNPTWGAWSTIIGQDEPSFHHPEFFGTINFK
jgi:hypothetical protein